MKIEDLDGVNKQILVELHNDGTQNPNKLSNKIKKENNELMSHVAIQKRIKKLKKNNILKIQGNINIDQLGLKSALLFIQFTNFNLSVDFIEKHQKCPRIFLILKLTGDFHIMMAIAGKDIEDINNFINFCLISDTTLIKSSSTMFSTEKVKPNFIPVDITECNNKNTLCGSSCLNCESSQKDVC